MITRLKHIKSTRKALSDGTSVTYYYHRRTNKRIHGEPGTPEFLESYKEASRSEFIKQEGDISGLIFDFKKSQEFSRLSPRTRSDYDKHLIKIKDKWGSMPLKVLEDIRIRKDLLGWRDELSIKSARQADYTWSVFRRLIQFGVHIGELTQNHLKNPGKLYTSERQDKIWLPENVSAFMKAASQELRLAMILALHTGQRQGDLLKLTWNAYDGNSLTLRQSKRKRQVYIPCTNNLKSVLDNTPRKALLILTNSYGSPWTSDGFRTSWYKTAKAAGITDLTFNDLRGTAVTTLAEQGCSEIEIATITGHSLKYVSAILDHYAARTKAIAKLAIERFEKSWVNDVDGGFGN